VVCHYIALGGPWSEEGMVLEKLALVGAGVAAGALVYFLMQYILKSDELTFIYKTYRDRIAG